MNSVLWFLIVFAAVGIGVWLASFVVEAIRPKPKAPAKLRWAPDIPIDTIEVGGHKLRYIKVGKGPALVLLHTLRTQLDLFEKVVPELSKHFTVYALDYPGHGYSDIPTARYDAAFFTEAVEGFLAKLDLRDVTLAGVSIGGSIVTYASLIPFIGETVMRLRNFLIMRAVLRGGVAEAKSIPPALLREMYLVGNRPGHYRAFLSLLRNAASWETATKDYGRIEIPVLLIWGDRDWARPSERAWRPLPGARSAAGIEQGDHPLCWRVKWVPAQRRTLASILTSEGEIDEPHPADPLLSVQLPSDRRSRSPVLPERGLEAAVVQRRLWGCLSEGCGNVVDGPWHDRFRNHQGTRRSALPCNAPGPRVFPGMLRRLLLDNAGSFLPGAARYRRIRIRSDRSHLFDREQIDVLPTFQHDDRISCHRSAEAVSGGTGGCGFEIM